MLPIVPVMQLLLAVDAVEGRKKLQKMVHILKELGAPFQERFEYSYYGMYSAGLRQEVEQLVAEKLIKEEDMAYPDGKKGFTMRSTATMKALLSQHNLAAPQPWEAVAKELNRMTAVQLEGVSTVFFLKARGHQGNALKARLLELKPHLSGEADFCCQEAEELSAKRLAA